MKYIWIFILFILTACTVETAVPAPTPLSTQANLAALSTIPVARPTSITEVTETAVPTILPTLTPTPQPTKLADEEAETHNPVFIPIVPPPPPTSTPDYSCSQSGTAVCFILPDSIVDLESNILNFVNSNGTWDEVVTLLTSLHATVEMAEVDFNGDGINEIVITVFITISEATDEGATWVFQYSANQYHQIFATGWGMFNFDVHTNFITDLNADGLPELFIDAVWQGSSCLQIILVLTWHSGEVQDYLEDNYLGVSCGAQTTAIDLDQDGIQEIIVTGTTSIHSDNSPPRGVVLTFKLTEGTYLLISTEYLPSEYSVHILDDAQRALDIQDFASAIHSYNHVAHDPTLIFISSYSFRPLGDLQDHPSEYQRAFALFRLSILQYIIGESENSAATMAELDATFPEGSIGHEFTVLAHLYMEKRAAGLLGVQACQEVTNYIETNYPDLELHIGDWGSNIAWYLNDTICPPYALPGS